MSLRARVLRAVAGGLYRTGGVRVLSRVAGRLAWGGPAGLRWRRQPAVPILIYHRVNDARDPFFPSLPTEVFEQQAAHLAATHRVLPLEELAKRLGRGAVPRDALAITFDDGYRDTLTHAAPILVKYRLPATLFLATGFIGSGAVPWFDRLALALKLTSAAALRLPSGERLALGGAADRLTALDRALTAVKALPDENGRRYVDETLDALGVTDEKCFKNAMLDWDAVQALTGLGFTIGAHTVNHPILARVAPRRAWDEIAGSRAMIHAALGRPPRSFAYPNGGATDYTESVKRLVREAGFECAVTTRFGLNSRRTDPYELRRGGPWEWHLPTFAVKLCWYRMARA